VAGELGGWQAVAPAVLAGLDLVAEDPGELDVLALAFHGDSAAERRA